MSRKKLAQNKINEGDVSQKRRLRKQKMELVAIAGVNHKSRLKIKG